MNFTRGKDPQESLKIGKYRDTSNLKSGDRIPAEFKLRLSCPEYYPLQRQKIVWATIIDISRLAYGNKILKCQIKDLEGYFYARYDGVKKTWIIDS